MDFLYLAQQCAPAVAAQTMVDIVRVESNFNPFAIGVVNGRLKRQPKNLDEAVATAKALEQGGHNFSLGAAQVNRYNLAKYSLDYARAFNPCESLRAGSGILRGCYDRAAAKSNSDGMAWQMAFSCYYSGNFKTGFRPDFKGQPSYVSKVLASAEKQSQAIPLVGDPARVPKAKKEKTSLPSPGGADSDTWSTFGAKEI